MNADSAVETVRRKALRVEPTSDGLGPLLDAVGDARLVLIGEATHGTHEFYRLRAEVTKALISGKGFNVVAVEADWPDAYRVNRWVRHTATESDAETAFDDFRRFPRWMWRNRDVVDFIQWLRTHNASEPATSRVGFYGLDLYSLRPSTQAVTGVSRRTNTSSRSRTRVWCGTPKSIIAPCSAGASSRGISAIRT